MSRDFLNKNAVQSSVYTKSEAEEHKETVLRDYLYKKAILHFNLHLTIIVDQLTPLDSCLRRSDETEAHSVKK